MDIVNNIAQMRNVLREDQGPGSQTMLADGTSVIDGGASLVIFLPSRIPGDLRRQPPGNSDRSVAPRSGASRRSW
ncbi:hypothetical protein QO004_005498 [Rhizobium mesoamericanum]|nr:hypothetical protein [Rhizobium mesoamericanum]